VGFHDPLYERARRFLTEDANDVKPQTFEALFDEHAQGLLAFLAYRLGDRATAEDVLADTFERALRSRRRLDPARGDGKSWLYTIALNLVRDRVRRAAVEQRAVERVGRQEIADAAPDTAARVELRQTVDDALTVLSAEEREAVALRYGADLTAPQIAQLLGLPLTTVEGRIYRALRRLRAELDP
jgi:RNA polymerase sigma-70 factor (ECF subfamily)